MAGFPINNAPFSQSSYIDDADFFDDDPARYSPPFSDEEYTDQMGYSRRNNVVDEYLNGFEVFEDEEEEQQFALSMANTPVTEAPPLRPARRATISTSRSGLQPTQTFAGDRGVGSASRCRHPPRRNTHKQGPIPPSGSSPQAVSPAGQA
ncbi:hypothetical protein GGTG_04889 [Gaeumannomyces tritici R3-111a-1]|uniref:Uncharacterized protein n=1 Tax=Gaeumannomyces tritici (strain R3-111a-1) TaxID=644352 RepID=J3NUD3_GAET3|nr:hypothetical protein GGTG_04889 [Gaeumannomyces tritici R3-111a-1]EJT79806.1 hypothetical protein GGTG_04889 [Gaeumannomyces tritici R3-111a-1]